MSERISVTLLALIGVAGFLLAPWAALNREIGARSTVLVLPGRIIDFTGRTDPVVIGGLEWVFGLGLLAFLVIAISAWLPGRARYLAWLAAGLLLLTSTAWGLDRLGDSVQEARVAAFAAEVQRAIDDPRPNQDPAALARVVAEVTERPLVESQAAARAAGVNVRRLPYSGTGMGLAAFLAVAIGLVAVVFGLRYFPRASKVLDRFLGAVAVPAISIALALIASGFVILLLQETPVGADVAPTGLEWLAGRLDTLWYAYQTLFANSLGSLPGLLESLKFATPLIFTGLAVAFGFRAGLFNIGAPGQMILGALAAAMVGLYLPGPRFLVLPAAVLAAAVGGGLWGALPGWLKARFGANEVINTILLNYVASSLLLFLLSDRSVFAAPALAAIRFLGVAIVAVIVLLLVPAVRRILGRRPRLSFAMSAVVLLIGMTAVALPRVGEPPVTVQMPFKAPGFEPKTYPLQPEARIPQVPALFGIDLRETPGVNRVTFDLAATLAPVVAVLVALVAPRLGLRRLLWRVLAFAVAWPLAYGGMAALGWRSFAVDVPPTNLNLSFLLALLAALFMQVFLWRTRWGYELRAVGAAPKAAEYGGADLGRNVIVAMAMAGAFAGLTATHYVLGGALEEYSLRQALPTNDGFDGIAVALLGANTPLGVVLAAFLFGVLKNGGAILNITFSNLTRDVVNMILALVVLFIAARGFLPESFANPLKRREVMASGEPSSEERTKLDPPGRPLRSEEG